MKAIALVTGAGDFPTPCGICRQVMAEFAMDDFEIIMSNDEKQKFIRWMKFYHCHLQVRIY